MNKAILVLVAAVLVCGVALGNKAEQKAEQIVSARTAALADL